MFLQPELVTTSDGWPSSVSALLVRLVVHELLGEVVVGELLAGCRTHLIVEVLGEGRLARQEPKILHVALIAAVDDRVVVVVCVNDAIIWLACERLAEECDKAFASGLVSGALSVAVQAEPWTAEATLARVVDLEVALRVKIRVLGLCARPGVRLEWLVGRVVNLVPEAHVAVRLEPVRESSDRVTYNAITHQVLVAKNKGLRGVCQELHYRGCVC